MTKSKRATRREKAVLIRLSDAENTGLEKLCEREILPAAQVLRRLLVREIRAAQPSELVGAK